MTRNKAPKIAARQRMAQTGEPYSVARRATAAGNARPDDPGAVDGPAAIDGPARRRRPRPPKTAQRQDGPRARPKALSPEEQYAREAEAAGLSGAEIEARLAAFRVQEAETADRAATGTEAHTAALRAQEAETADRAATGTEAHTAALPFRGRRPRRPA